MSKNFQRGWIRDISASVVRHPDFVMAVITSRDRDEVEAVLSRLLKEALAERRRGEQIRMYVPQGGGREAAEIRNRRLREAWRGDNLRELARDSGLSERQVRRVVMSR